MRFSGEVVTPDGEHVSYVLITKRIKRVYIRVSETGTVSVSAPLGFTKPECEKIILEHLGFVERGRRKSASHPGLDLLAGLSSLPLYGGRIATEYRRAEQTTGRFDETSVSGTVIFYLPDPDDLGWRKSAIEAYEKYKTSVAVSEYLAVYVPVICSMGAKAPTSVRYRRMTTRYGSCEAVKRSLNFNASLCEYPKPFIEYVVVHELCHLLEPNHSERFWELVDTVLPDRKARQALVKELND